MCRHGNEKGVRCAREDVGRKKKLRATKNNQKKKQVKGKKELICKRTHDRMYWFYHSGTECYTEREADTGKKHKLRSKIFHVRVGVERAARMIAKGASSWPICPAVSLSSAAALIYERLLLLPTGGLSIFPLQSKRKLQAGVERILQNFTHRCSKQMK